MPTIRDVFHEPFASLLGIGRQGDGNIESSGGRRLDELGYHRFPSSTPEFLSAIRPLPNRQPRIQLSLPPSIFREAAALGGVRSSRMVQSVTRQLVQFFSQRPAP